jgi:hypothetical protein
MNQRIGKLASEIERTRAKIADLGSKLKDLERQKTELENAEYIALIRELDMTPAELAAFLKSHTHGTATASRSANLMPIAQREKPKTGKEAVDGKE